MAFLKTPQSGRTIAIVDFAVRLGSKSRQLGLLRLGQGGRSARSTSYLTSFLLIASPFWFFSLSGRDDADDFDGLSVLVVFADRVGHQQQQMPSTMPRVCQRYSPPSIRSCSVRWNGSAKARVAVSKLTHAYADFRRLWPGSIRTVCSYNIVTTNLKCKQSALLPSPALCSTRRRPSIVSGRPSSRHLQAAPARRACHP